MHGAVPLFNSLGLFHTLHMYIALEMHLARMLGEHRVVMVKEVGSFQIDPEVFPLVLILVVVTQLLPRVKRHYFRGERRAERVFEFGGDIVNARLFGEQQVLA